MTDELKIDRPVRGNILETSRRAVPQIEAQEFLAEIDRLLAAPGVVGVVWEQYTPYFNDGDPCEFRIGDIRLILDGDDERDDEYEYEYEKGLSQYETYNFERGRVFPSVDMDATSWNDFNGVSGRVYYELIESVTQAAWESVALANFGDHAVVTATADGFDVEYYEHD